MGYKEHDTERSELRITSANARSEIDDFAKRYGLSLATFQGLGMKPGAGNQKSMSSREFADELLNRLKHVPTQDEFRQNLAIFVLNRHMHDVETGGAGFIPANRFADIVRLSGMDPANLISSHIENMSGGRSALIPEGALDGIIRLAAASSRSDEKAYSVFIKDRIKAAVIVLELDKLAKEEEALHRDLRNAAVVRNGPTPGQLAFFSIRRKELWERQLRLHDQADGLLSSSPNLYSGYRLDARFSAINRTVEDSNDMLAALDDRSKGAVRRPMEMPSNQEPAAATATAAQKRSAQPPPQPVVAAPVVAPSRRQEPVSEIEEGQRVRITLNPAGGAPEVFEIILRKGAPLPPEIPAEPTSRSGLAAYRQSLEQHQKDLSQWIKDRMKTPLDIIAVNQVQLRGSRRVDQAWFRDEKLTGYYKEFERGRYDVMSINVPQSNAPAAVAAQRRQAESTAVSMTEEEKPPVQAPAPRQGKPSTMKEVNDSIKKVETLLHDLDRILSGVRQDASADRTATLDSRLREAEKKQTDLRKEWERLNDSVSRLPENIRKYPENKARELKPIVTPYTFDVNDPLSVARSEADDAKQRVAQAREAARSRPATTTPQAQAEAQRPRTGAPQAQRAEKPMARTEVPAAKPASAAPRVGLDSGMLDIEGPARATEMPQDRPLFNKIVIVKIFDPSNRTTPVHMVSFIPTERELDEINRLIRIGGPQRAMSSGALAPVLDMRRNARNRKVTVGGQETTVPSSVSTSALPTDVYVSAETMTPEQFFRKR